MRAAYALLLIIGICLTPLSAAHENREPGTALFTSSLVLESAALAHYMYKDVAAFSQSGALITYLLPSGGIFVLNNFVNVLSGTVQLKHLGIRQAEARRRSALRWFLFGASTAVYGTALAVGFDTGDERTFAWFGGAAACLMTTSLVCNCVAFSRNREALRSQPARRIVVQPILVAGTTPSFGLLARIRM